MKNAIGSPLARVLLGTVSIGLMVLGPQAAQSQQSQACELVLPSYPNNAVDVEITDYYNYPLIANPAIAFQEPYPYNWTYSLFTVQVSGTPVPPIPADTVAPYPFAPYYSAWCAEAGVVLPSVVYGTWTPFSGYLFSSEDPNLNSELDQSYPNLVNIEPSSYVSQAVWKQVNYIINHRDLTKPPYSGSIDGYSFAYYWDVQEAITTLVGGPIQVHWDTYHPAIITALLNAAAANAPTWQPQCGDKIAALAFLSDNLNASPFGNPGDDGQLLFLEVPCSCSASFSIGVLPDVVCEGTSGQLVASVVNGVGPFTYQWTKGTSTTPLTDSGEFSGTATTTLTINPASLADSDSYTVTVTDAYGASASATTTFTVNPSPTLQVSGTDAACYGGNGSLTATFGGGTAPYTVSVDDVAAGVQTSPYTVSVSVGTHTVVVTDANGCSATGGATVGQPTLVTVSVTGTAPNCYGGSGSLTATFSGGTGPYMVSVDGGGAALETSPYTVSVSAGNHTVVVTDANGCSANGGVMVTQPTLVTVSVTGTAPSCNGGSGSITATFGGGTGPYMVSVDGGGAALETSPYTVSVAAGNHTVVVTDANGCAANGATTVSQPTLVTVSVTETAPNCNGGSGSITATFGGGTGPYMVSVDGGAAALETSPYTVSVSAGNHTVVVTDANGCAANGAAMVSQPTAVTVTVTGTAPNCYGGSGSITATFGGGTGPYKVSVDGGTVALEASPYTVSVSAGNHTVVVTDANGCAANGAAMVSQPTALSLTLAETPVLCNIGNDGTITATFGGGTLPYSISIDGGTPVSGVTSPHTFTGLTAKSHTVLVTDAAKCMITAGIAVGQSSTKPSITSVPTGSDLGCNPPTSTLPTDATIEAQVVASNATATNVAFVDSGTPCAMIRTFTITVSDACGNTSLSKTVVYTWTDDTTAPAITCPPAITIVTNTTCSPWYCTFKQGDWCGSYGGNNWWSSWSANNTSYGWWNNCNWNSIGNTWQSYVYNWAGGGQNWSAPCNGRNPANILCTYFNSVYPSGCVKLGVTDGTGYCLQFTSTAAIQSCLASSGNIGPLTCSANNPNSTSAGLFCAQVLALQLNVDCGSASGRIGFGGPFGNLIYTDSTSPCNGQTVSQILALANKALAGCNVSSGGCTLSYLSSLCDKLNQSFQGCQLSSWGACYLAPPSFCPPPSQSGLPTVMDNCDPNPTVTYSDSVAAGSCPGSYVDTRTWKAVDSCGNSSTCKQTITILGPGSSTSISGMVGTQCAPNQCLQAGTGLPGVLVTLDGQGKVVATTTTDSAGNYAFYNLTAGTYAVVVTPPANYTQTVGPGGSLNNQATVTVVSCQSVTGVNFGYCLTPLTAGCPSGNAQVNTAYSSALAAGGGTPPYAFSIVSGSLPPGLTLTPATGAIAGTPTTASLPPFNLGPAYGFAVLEIGNNANVSIAAAPPNGFINGNVGVVSGNDNLSDSGAPITGTVYLGTGAKNGGVSPSPSGGTVQYTAANYSSSSLYQAIAAATSASTTYGAMASSGGGVGVKSITSAGNGTLAPGVYNLTSFQLNGGTINLTPGQQYVFNISGTLSLQGGAQILDSTPGDVLFNITGTQGVQMNGGIGNEAVLDGIILAPKAQVALTPGFVDGEIISGQNINIASGASVQSPSCASGLWQFTAQVTDSRGQTATVSCGINVSCSSNPCSLPSPWQPCDVGPVSAPGSSCCSSGSYTLCGSGTDIWGTADGCHYCWQPANGNCTIVARVKSVQNTCPWAKAGVTIRETCNANASHCSVLVTPGNGVACEWRNGTGNSTYLSNQNSQTAPCWVKVVRNNNTFTGYCSPDGSNWTQVSSQTINMGTSVCIGLAVTSHDDGTLCTAAFDNVTATP